MPHYHDYSSLRRGQNGITGLETAIILIAFIVVAAVFSFTVLSSGVFATGKSSEAIYEGLQTTQQTLCIKGPVVASKNSIDTTGDRVGDTESVVTITFNVGNMMPGEGIDLTPSSYKQHHTQDKLQPNDIPHSSIINLTTAKVSISDCAWTAHFIGGNDGDYMLENNETVSITVWLVDYDYHPSVGNYYELGINEAHPFIYNSSDLLQPYDTFCLEIISDTGATLTIERTLPPHLDSFMNLN